MSFVQSHTVAVTTAADGTATAYTPVVSGRIAAILYTKDSTTPFASTADITVTAEGSGVTIWNEANVNASKTVHPVTQGDLPTGVQSTLTEVPMFAAGERVKIAISQGGNTKAGSFKVVIA